MDPNLSPHHYCLTPSARLALAKADIILWVGDGFEIYLADFMAEQAARTEIITAARLSGIHLLNLPQTHDQNAASQDTPLSANRLSEKPEQDAHSPLHDDHHLDYHLWLNTRNAALIAAAVRDQLIRLNPAQAPRFQRNLQRFQTKLRALEREIQELLPAPHTLNYITYHNSIQYIERQYGLPQRTPLLINPEVQPGMVRMLQVRARLRRQQPVCILRETESDLNLLATLLDGLQPRILTLDMLGFNLNPQSPPADYPALIRNLALQISGCRG